MILDHVPPGAEWVVSQVIWSLVFAFAFAFRVATSLGLVNVHAPAKKDHGVLSTWLRVKYNVTAKVYDVLDYPWERYYRKWRPSLVGDLRGDVLELGVGTGRNLPYYSPDATVVGVDLSPEMIVKAAERVADAKPQCRVDRLVVGNAVDVVTSGVVRPKSADVVVASFLFCVLPDELQPAALEQVRAALRVGGTFRLVELNFSKTSGRRSWLQWCWAPFVEWMYGARFDRRTLDHVGTVPGLRVDRCTYLSPTNDALVLIQGTRVE